MLYEAHCCTVLFTGPRASSLESAQKELIVTRKSCHGKGYMKATHQSERSIMMIWHDLTICVTGNTEGARSVKRPRIIALEHIFQHIQRHQLKTPSIAGKTSVAASFKAWKVMLPSLLLSPWFVQSNSMAVDPSDCLFMFILVCFHIILSISYESACTQWATHKATPQSHNHVFNRCCFLAYLTFPIARPRKNPPLGVRDPWKKWCRWRALGRRVWAPAFQRRILIKCCDNGRIWRE